MKDKIINVLAEINSKIVEDLERDLLATGIIDSFELVNMIVELEDELEIEIDPELVTPENFRTATAIINLIEDILNS